jgi:CheY-like chemotaxis protein
MNNEPEFWIMDDDTLYVRELIKALSEQLAGATIKKFETTAPLLAALDNDRRPAAVILDMMLAKDEWDNPLRWAKTDNPAKNGIEVARKLLESGVRPSVIGVITACYDMQQLQPLETAGILMENVLIKPAEIVKIRGLVSRMMESARRQQ